MFSLAKEEKEKKSYSGMDINRCIIQLENVNLDLKESEEKLRAIFEAAADGIIYLDNSGRNISANNKIEEMTGYRLDEIIGKNFQEIGIVDPKELPKLLTMFSEAIATGKSKKSRNFEVAIKRKDGTQFPAEINSNFVKKEGKIIGVIAIIRDITERKKAEEAIKESEEKIRSMFETAGDGIAYVDKTGKIVSVNRRLEDMFGYKRDELIGRNFSEIKVTDKKEMKRLLDLTAEIVRTGKTKENFEAKLIRKDREILQVEINAGIVRKSNEITGFSLIIRDATGRKEMEDNVKESRDALAKAYSQLKLLEKMKNDFVNISAHELKTPLVPIISYTELMLKNRQANEKEKEWLEICLRNAIRLKNLVTDISDISKLDAKSMRFDIRPIKIDNVIDLVSQDLKPAAKNKQLELIKQIEPGLPMVYGDPERIAQAISKLVENSIKFTDKGSITVSARKKDNTLIIGVTDTGIGIAKKDIPKLFVKFFQADTSITRKIKGTGLGLVICKEIIEAHNGKIWVESPGAGKGTTVSFSLKIAKK